MPEKQQLRSQPVPCLLLLPLIVSTAAALAMRVPQISAFGDDTRSDGGDVWMIEWDGKAKHWKQDAKVGQGVHCRLCVPRQMCVVG